MAVSIDRPCRVLEEDPDLAEVLAEPERSLAVQSCLARTMIVSEGGWPEVRRILSDEEGIGLLVLSGLLVRRVGVDGRFGAELLGPGDLLRPWQWEDAEPTLPVTTGWRVLERSRMALLDERFTACVGRHPKLAAPLAARALERSRNLAVNMAIVHQPRVEVRLHMLLWHLAGRWGVVGTEGVVLRLRLTHAILADLTAARRPTVSSALAQLHRREMVRPLEGGWLLSGRPPGELLELSPPGPSLREVPAAAWDGSAA
jgi:hypothetical protein